ncbi:MAG: hypothetical protein ABJF10_09300 [Chthoniobacter sp.]|uniref:hypothetical protein n=1 Tax=Chthoniobacter sp. TaxID=2510640 RepID=UPI0032ADDC91
MEKVPLFAAVRLLAGVVISIVSLSLLREGPAGSSLFPLHDGEQAGEGYTLNQFSDYWEQVRNFYAPFDTAPKSGSAEVYLHEVMFRAYAPTKAFFEKTWVLPDIEEVK